MIRAVFRHRCRRARLAKVVDVIAAIIICARLIATVADWLRRRLSQSHTKEAGWWWRRWCVCVCVCVCGRGKETAIEEKVVDACTL